MRSGTARSNSSRSTPRMRSISSDGWRIPFWISQVQLPTWASSWAFLRAASLSARTCRCSWRCWIISLEVSSWERSTPTRQIVAPSGRSSRLAQAWTGMEAPPDSRTIRASEGPRLALASSELRRRRLSRPTNCESGSSRDVLERLLDHPGETVVGEEDGPFRRDGQAGLGHRLDHQPVEALGLAEREDPLALAAGDDDGVDLAFADGPEGVLGLGQLAPQALELAGPLRPGFAPRHALPPDRLGAGGRRFGHSLDLRSRPTRMRSVSAMSPIIRRNGRGSFLIRVGAAMICSPRARVGWR